MAASDRSLFARLMVLAVLVLSPFTSQALVYGHPEELLGGVLCLAALLLAHGRRPVLAGIVLGLALATKQWAVLAVLPVIAVAPTGRGRLLATAGGLAAAFTLPGLLADSGGFVSGTRAIADANSWVSPQNIWWWVSHDPHRIVFDGVTSRNLGRHVLPGWANPIPHPLIIALGIGLAGALMARTRRPTLDQALALLALLFVLRCVLDPWNNAYYHVPLILCLLTRDGVARRGLPIGSALATAALWFALLRLPQLVGTGTWSAADTWNAVYLALTGSLVAWLALSAFAPAWLARLSGRLAQAPRTRVLGAAGEPS
jgi:hypothetical protein